MKMFSDKQYPRAIVHFDGDSFFASVEQAMNYTLRGKPIITGAERGAATALSYEAKVLGLSRGMTLREIRQKCPDAVVVPSDYTTYCVYARRMYAIARRFTPYVEEYSIDECFADITHLGSSAQEYEAIAKDIQHALHTALGITFGVGLGPSKVLAKTASKARKPAGFTAVPIEEISQFLERVPIGNIWGIGYATSIAFQKLHITTALDFISRTQWWLKSQRISKPYRAIWHELRGESVLPVRAEMHEDIGSVMKSRTFSPPSTHKECIYSQLSKNVERACAVLRAHGMRTRYMSFFLKTQEFQYGRVEFELAVATNNPIEILKIVRERFERLFIPGILYRATGVSLHSLVHEQFFTHDLFGVTRTAEDRSPVLGAVDALNARYGKNTVMLGSSLQAAQHIEPSKIPRVGRREAHIVMPKEYAKKTIDLPFLGIAR